MNDIDERRPMRAAKSVTVMFAAAIVAAGCGGPQVPTATPPPSAAASATTPDVSTAPRAELGAQWSEPVRLPTPFGATVGRLLAASDGSRIVALGSTVGLDATVTPTSWISEDGVRWTSVELGDAFAGVQPADMIATDLGFLVVGALGTPMPPELAVDDLRGVVLVSPDGVHWERHEDPAFEGAYVMSVARGPRGMVAAGFAPSPDELLGDCPDGLVWTSPDGLSWTSSEAAIPWCGRGVVGLVSGEGRVFAAGRPAGDDGAGPASASSTAVWSSSDGSSWTELGSLPKSDPISIGAMAADPDGVVLIGTQQEAAEQRQLAWSFPAGGMSAPPEPSVLPGDGRLDGHSSSLVAVPGGGFVASGMAAGTNSPRTVIWTASDGAKWTEIENSRALEAAAPMSTMVVHGSSLVGFGGLGTAAVWLSPAESAPQPPQPELDLRFESAALPEGEGRPAGIAISDAGIRLVVATDSDPGSEPTTRVWRSSDGETWDIATPGEFAGGHVDAVAWSGSQFVVVGGEFVPSVGQAPLAWTSSDGITWARARVGPAPGDPSFWGTRFTGLSATEDGVLVAVGRGSPALPEDCPALVSIGVAWRSTDGVSWQRITDGTLACAMTSSIARAGDHLVIVGSRDTVELRTSGNAAAADETNRPAAWTSADGITWTEAAFPDGAPLVRLEAVAAGPAGVVATGHAPRPIGGPAFFRSDDGRTWEVAEYDERIEPADALVTGLGTADGGYVAVGYLSDLRRERGTAAAWTSVDGQTWVRVLGDPFGELMPVPFGLVSPVWHDGRLLALGLGAEQLSLWQAHRQ